MKLNFHYFIIFLFHLINETINLKTSTSTSTSTTTEAAFKLNSKAGTFSRMALKSKMMFLKSKKAKKQDIVEDLKTHIELNNPSLMSLTAPKIVDQNGQSLKTENNKKKETIKQMSKFNDNQVYWKGWIKYFKYNSNKGPGKLTNFFRND